MAYFKVSRHSPGRFQSNNNKNVVKLADSMQSFRPVSDESCIATSPSLTSLVSDLNSGGTLFESLPILSNQMVFVCLQANVGVVL